MMLIEAESCRVDKSVLHDTKSDEYLELSFPPSWNLDHTERMSHDHRELVCKALCLAIYLRRICTVRANRGTLLSPYVRDVPCRSESLVKSFGESRSGNS